MPDSTLIDEKSLLRAYLDAQRKHVLGILEGLSDADMHRAVLPSGWSAAGLVNHLALDDERFWFRAVMAGEPPAIERAGKDADAWKVSPETPAADIVDLYQREVERSNAVIEAMSLQAQPAWWPDFFRTSGSTTSGTSSYT